MDMLWQSDSGCVAEAAVDLPVCGLYVPLIIQYNLCVVDVLRIGTNFLEATQRHPYAQRPGSTLELLDQWAIQRLRCTNRLQPQTAACASARSLRCEQAAMQVPCLTHKAACSAVSPTPSDTARIRNKKLQPLPVKGRLPHTVTTPMLRRNFIALGASGPMLLCSQACYKHSQRQACNHVTLAVTSAADAPMNVQHSG
jgi:hypothetical protein